MLRVVDRVEVDVEEMVVVKNNLGCLNIKQIVIEEMVVVKNNLGCLNIKQIVLILRILFSNQQFKVAAIPSIECTILHLFRNQQFQV